MLTDEPDKESTAAILVSMEKDRLETIRRMQGEYPWARAVGHSFANHLLAFYIEPELHDVFQAVMDGMYPDLEETSSQSELAMQFVQGFRDELLEREVIIPE